jgi:hypothetical protein
MKENNNNNNGENMSEIQELQKVIQEAKEQLDRMVEFEADAQEDLQIFQEIGDEESIEETTLNLIHVATLIDEVNDIIQRGEITLQHLYNDEFNNIMKGME